MDRARTVSPAWWLAAVVAVLTLTVLALWAIAWNGQTEAQREADAKMPELGPVLVPVTSGALVDSIAIQADVVPSAEVDLSEHVGALGEVVTAVGVAVGHGVGPGEVLIAVDDRPLIVLEGEFPSFRDVAEGTSGTDVAQLQRGLIAAGFAIGDDSGYFGEETRQALIGLYARVGYTPMGDVGSGMVPLTQGDLDSGVPLVVPRYEVAFVSHGFPLTILAVPTVGNLTKSGSQSLLVGSGSLGALASAPAGVLVRIPVGSEGTVTGPQGEAFEVTIGSVEEGEAEAGGQGTVRAVLSSGESLPASWLQHKVLLTVTIAVVAEESLLVPTRAVVLDASGGSSVVVSRSEGMVVTPVRVVGRLDGLTAVEPSGSETLSAGDLVAIDG